MSYVVLDYDFEYCVLQVNFLLLCILVRDANFQKSDAGETQIQRASPPITLSLLSSVQGYKTWKILLESLIWGPNFWMN